MAEKKCTRLMTDSLRDCVDVLVWILGHIRKRDLADGPSTFASVAFPAIQHCAVLMIGREDFAAGCKLQIRYSEVDGVRDVGQQKQAGCLRIEITCQPRSGRFQEYFTLSPQK